MNWYRLFSLSLSFHLRAGASTGAHTRVGHANFVGILEEKTNFFWTIWNFVIWKKDIQIEILTLA